MESRGLHHVCFWILAGAMMNLFLILFSFMPAFAQTPVVTSLNETSALVSHISIPFRVSNVTVQEMTTTVTSANNSCRAMNDPFLKQNFFVKCLLADQFHVRIWMKTASGENIINYGPVNVSLITDQTVVTPEPEDPRVVQGQSLFLALCSSCHSKGPNFKPTATDITSAISRIGVMRSISLTAAEKSAIEYYLSH